MEFWKKLNKSLKQKGFSAQQVKKLEELFGNLDATALLNTPHGQLLPAMSGRTVAEKREKIELLLSAVREIIQARDAGEEGHVRQTSLNSTHIGGLNAYAAFTINGTAISGDTTVASAGGVDVSSGHIELYSVEWGARIEGQARRAASSRQILPIRIHKRIDQSTPDFYRALAQNAALAGEIKIFDMNPEVATIRYRFRITISGARVISAESRSPGALEPANSNRPPYEVIEIVPHTVTYTDVVHSKEYTDEW